MMRLQPVGAMAVCSVFPGDEQEMSKPVSHVDEKVELQRRLDDLTKRVRYIEERLSIVRREGGDSGVEA